MKISESDEFKKDFKKIAKKYRSIEDDFEILKRAIKTEPLGDGTKHWNCIAKIEERDITFLKVRMMCRAIKGSSLRVIYMYNNERIEVLFIEIYSKNKKENEYKSWFDDIIKKYRN